MKTTTVTIRGVSPLIMHNGQLADPLNEHTQALARLTSKRKKTLDDHREIGRVEWMGGLYLDEKLRPCLPGEVIEGALVSGAKKFKLGKDAKSGIVVAGNFAVIFDGPKDPDKLWATGKHLKRAGVKVSGGSAPRSDRRRHVRASPGRPRSAARHASAPTTARTPLSLACSAGPSPRRGTRRRLCTRGA